ncbi:hypothetical protein Ddc_04645 [Ditylenchus destructor]|nr:hypothetical protein Ddc_04645 [Ditylenchus destructor]
MPQPIYPKLFRDILSYLERCEHEMIQDTCSLANRLVDNDFPEKPCHVWDSLVVEKGKKNVINVILRHKSKVWNPVTRTWLANYSWQNAIRSGHYSLEQMMPYIGKKSRVKATQIRLWNEKFAQQDMKVFESLAHIWEGQFVAISPEFATDEKAYRAGLHNLNLLLNTSAVFRCRELELPRMNIAFANYPLLYSLSVLRVDIIQHLRVGHVAPGHWVDFLENIDQNGGKVVPFIWFEPIQSSFALMEMLNAIRIAFSKSNKPCKFKLYILVLKCQHNPLTEFLDANETSHEMLQLSTVPESDAKNIFKKLTNIHRWIYLLYLLERKKV